MKIPGVTKKGSYGYISNRRIVTLIRSVVLFALSFSLYFFGLNKYDTNKNLFTIVSVLSFLPASGSFVNFVMFMRAKACSSEQRDEIEKNDHHNACSYYDLFFTSEKKNYPVYHICIRDNTVIGLIDKRVDPAAIEKHIKDLLSADGYKEVTVKAFDDTGKYTERLSSLSGREPENEKLTHGIIDTLFSISLS
ncbi:MAG: hypothetical protein K6E33_06590 [Lachnospiraceae bacterium]|nr:hypothetical protein [Lachnospiraceae bacterium]